MSDDAAAKAAARIQEEFLTLHDRWDEEIKAGIEAIIRDEWIKAAQPRIATDGTSSASGYSGPPLIFFP